METVPRATPLTVAAYNDLRVAMALQAHAAVEACRRDETGGVASPYRPPGNGRSGLNKIARLRGGFRNVRDPAWTGLSGRPRQYSTAAARQRAYRQRRQAAGRPAGGS